MGAGAYVYRVLGVCFVCQTIHYNVLAVLINTTLVADVKMAVMDTYRKINLRMCVSWACLDRSSTDIKGL